MVFRLKTSTEKLEKLGNGGVNSRISREASIDSFTSVIFPWRTIPQRPRQVAGNQAGREVNPSGYFLCMASVLLLTTGIGICTATLWAIICAIPYMYLTDGAVPFGNNIFSFCAGILSIPCCWIACTSHDSKKNYTFLPLLMLLTAFSLTMLATSVTMGLIHKSQIKCDKRVNPPKLLNSNYQKMLNETLFDSMSLYDTNRKHQMAWNTIQKKLKCCGSLTYKDWINVRSKIPLSCCQKSVCKHGKIYTQGCLSGIALDILWQISFISGLSSIVFAAQMFTLCMASYMYLKEKLQMHLSSTSIRELNSSTVR